MSSGKEQKDSSTTEKEEAKKQAERIATLADDKDVRKIDDVLVYLEQATEVGETVRLTVWRDGQIIEINVTLGARPSLQDSP